MHGMEPLREEGGVWLLGSVAQTGGKKNEYQVLREEERKHVQLWMC